MSNKTGYLNPNIPAPELAKVMTTAASKMKDYSLPLLTPQLILRVILDDGDCAGNYILQKLSKQRGFDWSGLVARVETMARNAPGRDANFRFTDDFGKDIPLTEEILIAVDEALSIAQSREELKVTTAHFLAALADQKITTYGVLQRVGVTQAAIISLLNEVQKNGTLIIQDFIDEAKNGTVMPLFERKELIDEILSVIGLSSRRHIILVGPEGAGKRSLAQSLAVAITSDKQPTLRSLVQISETALLEDPLAAIRSGMRRASRGILIVPTLYRFFPGTRHFSFPPQVNSELHKALLGDEHIIIGTATAEEYERLATVRLIRERSHRIDVRPATVDETISILNYHKPRLEQEYQLSVQREALIAAAQLSGQYMKTVALPGSAVQLADRACALVKTVSEGKIKLERQSADGSLTAEDVMIACSRMTKIPVSKLSPDESSRYANMVDHLHQNIIGQEEAVMAVSRAVKIARVGLRNPKQPIGSFLFLGPSGVGKTELAKALAEFMFGSQDSMVVLDMSEYQEEASVNRMIGAPPGYVGYDSGGQLTDFVREHPYTVVLLDEIEKAHPRVLDVLLQVMEEGRLTDGQGRLTTFSEAVVIMTSNIGSYQLMTPVIGERERESVMKELFKFLRPEFVNRLDEVILFHQLTPEQLAQILDLLLKKEVKLAQAQGITLTITPEAKTWMLSKNDQPEFGARPLRRIIAKHLRERLADYLLNNPTAKQTEILVSADTDHLIFTMKQNA